MAGESTYSLVQSFTPTMWEAALMYLRNNFVVSRYVNFKNDMTGLAPRSITGYTQKPVGDNIPELTDLSSYRQQLERKLLTTVTPKEIGTQYLLTDNRVETDTENAMADCANTIGFEIGSKVENDLTSTFTTFSRATLGATNTAFSLDLLVQGRSLLQTAGIAGPYTAVISPMQYLDIAQSLLGFSSPADFAQRGEAAASYFVTQWAGVSIVVSPFVKHVGTTNEVQNIALSGSPTGGTFTLKYQGWETVAIAYNASTSTVQTALNALPPFSLYPVTVTSGTNWVVTYSDGQKNTLIELGTNSLTGGTSPSLTITRTTAGAGYAVGGIFTKDAVLYDLRRRFRMEPERDASARATEMNATMIYGASGWETYKGIKLLSDDTQPVS